MNDTPKSAAIADKIARAAVFCYRRPLLRWLGVLLAWEHKRRVARRVDDLASTEEASNTLGWWWLSFADPQMPEGRRFLGVAIVEGYGIASASIRAHELDINPDGAVQGMRLADGDVPDASLRNRLLSRDELVAADLI